MNLSQQVVSLDLAKRMKELGAPQKESAFTWVQEYPDGGYKLQSFHTQFYGAVRDYHASGADDPKHPMFAAYTVAELDEWLRYSGYAVLVQPDGHFFFKQSSESALEYGMIGGHGFGPDKKGADARARLWIYLKENKLI